MIRLRRSLLLWLCCLVPLLCACAADALPGRSPTPSRRSSRPKPSPLPEPDTDSGPPLTQALARRRSVRFYGPRSLTQQEIGQLLWAAQGISSDAGLRTAPSAGATYPLEMYVASSDGLFRYQHDDHSLVQLADQDPREDLAAAGLNQPSLRGAPVVFVMVAIYSRTAAVYGDRTERYVHMEAGHACQNLLLQAQALGLGAVPIGAFVDDGVSQVLGLPDEEAPLYLVPVGEPA